MKPLRILLADDHEVVRRGIRALLESHEGWTICGEVPDGRSAVEQARQLAPDLVILDIAMPGLNGLDAARQIRELAPAVQILILTMYDSDQLVRQVLESGARGYLLKSDAGRELINAVEALSQQKPFFTARVAEKVLGAYLGEPAKAETPRIHGELTPREREVVQLLAEGKTSKELASILEISIKTAETHRTNVMRKLGAHSLSELVRYAIRNQIIEA
ncbi:MAG TPA: response regulator transcription factor [Candidatus Eisenbacteria bacterium]|jgi:DNA-binding NarL/FixJ family response regulator